MTKAALNRAKEISAELEIIEHQLINWEYSAGIPCGQAITTEPLVDTPFQLKSATTFILDIGELDFTELKALAIASLTKRKNKLEEELEAL